VVCLQAQAERDDPLGRDRGEWLWTDWFSEAHWQRERAVQGERNWAALFQQRPKPAEGALIKRAWVQRYRTPPAEFIRIVQSWDTAYKDSEINDPSVCTTWGETRKAWYLLHVFRDRLDYPDLKRAVASLAGQWQPHAILIEDKSSGQSLIQEMRAGFAVPVIAIDPGNVSKLDRLVAVSSLYEAGQVFLPEQAPWLMDYESELFGFPLTSEDDQVDSTSQALNWLFTHSGRYEAYSTGQPRTGMAAVDSHDELRDTGYGSIGSGDDMGGFI
jgi:predicted phage terminase large subunit-like protein